MKKLLLDWIKWTCFGKSIMILYLCLLWLIGRITFNMLFTRIEEKWHMPSPRLFKTIYFNIRCLGFSKGGKMPVFIYNKTELISLKGNVDFNCKIESKLVKVGWDYRYRSIGDTRIRIDGNVTFDGACVIARGSNIAVFENGSLNLGNMVTIWENCLIYCTDRITLGDYACITFQTSIMDSDFHYMVDINSGMVRRRSKPITVGDHVWIGNRANIKKGAIIPKYTIVASSNSLVSKDYTDIEPFSIIGGIPAKVIGKGFARLWEDELSRTRMIDQWFQSHPDELTFNALVNNKIEDLIGDEFKQ